MRALISALSRTSRRPRAVRRTRGRHQTHHIETGDPGRRDDAAQFGELLGISVGQPVGSSSLGTRQITRIRQRQRLALSLEQGVGADLGHVEQLLQGGARERRTLPYPCTSTRVPASVATTFMSTSARESSSYGRSRRTRPSTTPTLTAAIAHESGCG